MTSAQRRRQVLKGYLRNQVWGTVELAIGRMRHWEVTDYTIDWRTL